MKIKVILLTTAGFIFLALGAIGLFLPLLPTTPFVLAAAGCFSYAPSIKKRVMRIPFVKDHIKNYKDRKGLPRKTVIVNLIFLWAMLIISCIMSKAIPIMALLFVVGTAVTIHILHMAKPKPSDEKKLTDLMEKQP